MNRKQRRETQNSGRIENINLRDITYPWQMSDAECEQMAGVRLADNLAQTAHPFHHRTANGAIVDSDPTLEYYLSRLTPEKQKRIREGWESRIKPDAPKAIPVNRTFYGYDLFEIAKRSDRRQ